MSSDNGIITLGDAIIYLRMSDFRDEDFTTFGEREQQLRGFASPKLRGLRVRISCLTRHASLPLVTGCSQKNLGIPLRPTA